MSAAMEKRLAKLEARRPPADWWRDPYPLMLALRAALEAVRAADRAGRPFSRLAAPELSAEAEEQVALALKESDRIHARLKGGIAGAGLTGLDLQNL
jgi:hypothetical protein